MKLCKGIAINLRANEEDTIASGKGGYYQEQPYEFTDVFAAPPVHESYIPCEDLGLGGEAELELKSSTYCHPSSTKF
jgi:hypothetical protein